MEVENTHIQNEKPEFAAHTDRERPLWCRWWRLRAVYPSAQDVLAEYSRPFGKSDPHRRCVVRSLPAIPGERQAMNSSPLSFVRQSIESVYQAAKQRLRRWTKPDNHDPALYTAMDLTRTKSELLLENMLLRQQIIVLKRQAKRPALTWRDRTLFVLLASRLRTWKQALVIVQSETVLRWRRDLFRWVWRRKSRPQRRGQPPLAGDIISLIRKIAKENRSWGAERIRGELLKLGVQVSKSTVQKYIYEVRKLGTPKQTWAIFLRNHAGEIWAVISSRPMTSPCEPCSSS
jgi:hypothetical protein